MADIHKETDPAKYPGFLGVGYPEVFTTMPPQPTEKKPGQLPPEKVQEYFEKGYTVVENFFTLEEIEPCRESYRHLVDEIAQKLYKTGRVKNLYEDYGLENRLIMLEKEWPGAVTLLLKLGKLTPEFRAMYQNEKLLNALEQLLGPDVGASPVWNTRPKTPGHRETHVQWHQGADPTKDFVKCPVKAGGVVFFSNLTPHRSVPNRSDHVRWAMDLRYQNPKRPWGFHGLKKGIILRSAEQSDIKPDWDVFNTDRYDLQKDYEIKKLVHGNGLLDRLVKTGRGCHIGEICCVAPTCADDMFVLSDTQDDLQLLLNIAVDNSIMEKYVLLIEQEGSLCAQHCLNALLQGQYFSAVDLAEIANQLDEQERHRMAEGGTESQAYQHFIEQPSSNYDDSGFFSVQVIDNALRVWGLELLPYNSQNEISTRARDDPTQMNAYICNFGEHWFAIRRLGRQWFNLNSLLTGPELLSDTFLRLFLTQLQQDGYSIFVVIGNLMECEADQLLNLIPAVQPIRPQLIADATGSKVRAPGQAAGSGATGGPVDDEHLKQALKESKQLNEHDDKSLQRALQMSMEGYIEESVGRIEQATAAGQQTSQGQGQTENTVEKGEGHTLGSNNADTEQEPSAAPSAEEVRERRLAFFSQPAKNIANDNSVSENGDITPDDTDSDIVATQSVGNKTGKLASELTEEEMLEQAIALSMQQGDT